MPRAIRMAMPLGRVGWWAIGWAAAVMAWAIVDTLDRQLHCSPNA